MNRYVKLVNFELNRFMKIYLVLIVVTIISQITGVIVQSNNYISMANRAMYEEGMSKAQFLQDYGTMDIYQLITSIWFSGPIALCIAALIFYTFLIWYRDWFGKNTFVYRLLMLPTARLNVFLAKATTIFLLVLGLVSLQLILLPIESNILKWIVPLDFRTDLSINEMLEGFNYLNILVPQSFIEFILHYGVGFMSVFILFTAILFERSYRLKGIFLGAGYSVLAIIVFFLPVLIVELTHYYLYPVEILIAEITFGLFVSGMSIWVSHFLLIKEEKI